VTDTNFFYLFLFLGARCVNGVTQHEGKKIKILFIATYNKEIRTAVRIFIARNEVRSKHITNTSQERYRLSHTVQLFPDNLIGLGFALLRAPVKLATRDPIHLISTVACSPQANYTDRATAACRRS
jgi:hypothetical protein